MEVPTSVIEIGCSVAKGISLGVWGRDPFVSCDPKPQATHMETSLHQTPGKKLQADFVPP